MALWLSKDNIIHVMQARLTTLEINSIINIFRQKFLPDDKLWIFGSRADMTQKGGDIDLYVQTKISNYSNAFNIKKSFLMELKAIIGDQKIDLVLDLGNKKLDIYEVAQKEGVRLC